MAGKNKSGREKEEWYSKYINSPNLQFRVSKFTIQSFKIYNFQSMSFKINKTYFKIINFSPLINYVFYNLRKIK